MRFIYLSTTKENHTFGTRESTIKFFKEYFEPNANTNFYFGDRKIDKSKFKVGEDIFFLRADKTLDYYSYEVIAYCRARSEVYDATAGDEPNKHYFYIDPQTLKIFKHRIDINSFQQFIDDPINKVKSVKLAGNIEHNQFNGPYSWIYFNDKDSEKIMKWFRKVVLSEEIEVLTNI